ncbi:hypothetical protein T440DRAFT_533728 [Plenodomus tracheiphilus IPT5]|uniref:Uncharacterized protein n=1 Tax=Plenodomus tracheiphilus IPT5 TaxID=1408161 RepID=A0A6A7B4F6_9PLEO|nr:hypothetical protein T440DRAFT_533728 [Plenodomus tracheiphilus IPT5]
MHNFDRPDIPPSHQAAATLSITSRASSTTTTSPSSTSTSAPKKTPKARKNLSVPLGWISRQWNRSWTAEIFACIVTIFSLGGLILTLLTHQNRPLPQWPQLVTINSIISMLRTAHKG